MDLNNGNPLVSLITVNYNGRQYLPLLLESLKKLTYSPVEFILVDNASSDDSVDFVRRNYPHVKVIQNPENFMFARGNNEGIRAARGEIICLINNDVKADPDFLRILVDQFMKKPEMAAAQPKVLDLNDEDRFEYAGAAGGFIDRYGYPFMRGRLFFTLEKDTGQYNELSEIFWATGACFLIRKSVLEKIGLLDEDFRMHMEEIDLCWRMHLIGFRLFCVPAARVWHKGGGTLSSENPRKVYWNFRNNIFLLVKNLHLLNLIRIIPVRLLLDSVAFAREIISGNLPNALSIGKAYFWILSHPKIVLGKRRKVQNQRQLKDDKIFKLIYPGSIVWEYFVRGRKRFSDLKRINAL
ncbi:MAG: glycosyltransferase family 2 protein [Calditrichaeota bacterium]|nr:glycosyltransferase family 2 protein [Calditrichota bacterium]RQV99583.1 MAG: glycosyltransferase family 2 protein [Calditrichota bacterium]